MLVGIINALQDPTKGGCWASNDYLAQRWGKSTKHVSVSISLFEELGIFTIKRRPNERLIKANFQGDDITLNALPKGNDPHYQKVIDPLPKGKTYRKQVNKEQEIHTAGAVKGFFPDESNNTPQSKNRVYQLCVEFDEFVLARRWRHKDDARPNLGRWRTACEELIERLDDDFQRFQEVVRWYFTNYKDPYLRNHAAITSLCKNFFGLEKAMCRKLKRPLPKDVESEKVHVVKDDDEWENLKKNATAIDEIDEIPE